MSRAIARAGRAGGLGLLAAVLVGVVVLADARPPDPTWIAGIYDDADYDDAVLALLAVAGVLAAPAVTIAIVGLVERVPRSTPPPLSLPSIEVGHSRSPPRA